ncbi:13943_t:CDS:2, partial [Gigaspora rosea]
ELQKRCTGNLENIKFHSNGKAEISYSNVSVIIKHNNSQHIDNTKIEFLSSSTSTNLQLQRQQQMPLIFKKAINTFGKEELERLKNFESVGEPSSLIIQFKKRINNEEFKQIEKSKKSKVEKDVEKWQRIADMLYALGAEITESTNYLVENLALAKLKHFINLIQAYSVLKELVVQDPPKGNKMKLIKYKKINNIPLGENSTPKSKRGWILAKMQHYFKIDARAERRTWTALCLVNQLLSERLVTLESLVTTKASPNFFKTINLSYYPTFYRRVKGDENSIFKIDLDN